MTGSLKLVAALLCIALGSPLAGGLRAAAPAVADDVAGTWAFVLDTPGGVRNVNATFKVEGKNVTGTWDSKAEVRGTFADGGLDLSFPLEAESGSGTLGIKARLAKEELTGSWTFQEYSGTFKATRAATAPK